MSVAIAENKNGLLIDFQTATDALHAAISEVLEEDIPSLTRGMRLFEDLRMDSTTMLETLMVLEESLGFDVDPEDLEIEDFLTIENYSSFLVKVCAQ